MKSLALKIICLVSAAQFAACIFVDGDDNPEITASEIQFDWTLDGGCPANARFMAFYAIGGDPNDDYGEITDGCVERGTYISPPLPRINYTDVGIDLLDGNENPIAQSYSVGADLTPGGRIVLPEFVFATDGGYMNVAWTISNSSGAPLTCAQAGVADGAILATASGGDVPSATDCVNDANCFAFEWQCDDLGGITDKMPFADYAIEVDLLNSSKESLNGRPVELNASIEFGNQLVDLGSHDFVFAGQ